MRDETFSSSFDAIWLFSDSGQGYMKTELDNYLQVQGQDKKEKKKGQKSKNEKKTAASNNVSLKGWGLWVLNYGVRELSLCGYFTR